MSNIRRDTDSWVNEEDVKSIINQMNQSNNTRTGPIVVCHLYCPQLYLFPQQQYSPALMGQFNTASDLNKNIKSKIKNLKTQIKESGTTFQNLTIDIVDTIDEDDNRGKKWKLSNRIRFEWRNKEDIVKQT